MLRHLFPGLTRGRSSSGEALMAALIAAARNPRWYREGGVPDTIDGRFRMLATLTALTMVRLDQLGREGEAASARLTERFVELMETEHRELGLGDPSLGKKVRQLIGALGKRVGLWRVAAQSGAWVNGATESVYSGQPDGAQLQFTAAAIEDFWSRLGQLPLDRLEQGALQ